MIIRLVAALLAALAGVSQAWASEGPPCQSSSADAIADIRQAADGAVVSYRFSKKFSCFRLVEAGKVRTLTWKLLTAGAQLGNDGNTIVLAKPANKFEIKILPFARDGQIALVYSPVIAFGDGSAMAVYSRYLAGTEGTKVVIKFTGYLPIGSTSSIGKHSFLYRGDDTYLIVGKPQVIRKGQSSLVLDRAMPLADRACQS